MDRAELRALETLFSSKFDAHEELDKQRFDSLQKLSDERQSVITTSLTAIRENAHSLNNKLTPIFALPARVDEIVGDLDDVPRNKDLDTLSKNVTTQIGDLKKTISDEKEDSNKRITRTIALMGLILAALTIALKLLG